MRNKIKFLLFVALLIFVGTLTFNLILKSKPRLIVKSMFGKEGIGLGEFRRPAGLDICGNYLFVADMENNRIQILKIKPNGALSPVSTFGKLGTGIGEFNSPVSLAINNNYLFVVDSANNRIQVLNVGPNGSLSPVSTFGKGCALGKEAGIGEFNSPIGLAVSGNYLYVAEMGSSRIQILNISPNGNLSPVSTFGKMGAGIGEFMMPMGLTIIDKHLFVADTSNNRIQVLNMNPDGNLSPIVVSNMIEKDGILNGFDFILGPTFLVKKGKYLYVTDTRIPCIWIFKIDSNTYLSVSNVYLGENPFDIDKDSFIRTGIAIKGKYLYATDTEKHRIQIFEIKNP